MYLSCLSSEFQDLLNFQVNGFVRKCHKLFNSFFSRIVWRSVWSRFLGYISMGKLESSKKINGKTLIRKNIPLYYLLKCGRPTHSLPFDQKPSFISGIFLTFPTTYNDPLTLTFPGRREKLSRRYLDSSNLRNRFFLIKI